MRNRYFDFIFCNFCSSLCGNQVWHSVCCPLYTSVCQKEIMEIWQSSSRWYWNITEYSVEKNKRTRKQNVEMGNLNHIMSSYGDWELVNNTFKRWIFFKRWAIRMEERKLQIGMRWSRWHSGKRETPAVKKIRSAQMRRKYGLQCFLTDICLLTKMLIFSHPIISHKMEVIGR